MPRLRFIVFTAMLIGLLCAPTASAQTVANLSIVSGNGQVICQTCLFKIFRFFEPMVVQATDASGNPVPNVAVNWTQTLGAGGMTWSQTYTDLAGLTSNLYIQPSQPGFFSIPFLQSTIVAASGSGVATFTLTQALTATGSGLQFVQARLASPDIGTTLSGTAGTQSSTAVQIHMDAWGVPVPNASLRLINNQDPATGPSVSCATGAGADPGSVLTDASGDATCTPVFGGIAGNGTFSALVGGVASSINNLGLPVGFDQFGTFFISVTPGVPGVIQIVGGNNQSVNPGQAVASTLTAKVGDQGGNPLGGQTVTWTVSPVGAATLSSTRTSSDSNGLVSTNVVVSSSAAGTVQVRVALVSNPNLSATFTITVNVTISALQKLSGDQQTAIINSNFAQPLVVQVNGTNGQPVVNYPVQFSAAGPATLASQSANTDSSGRAQMTVSAGSTTGAVTVTASIGAALTQTFNLTVIPAGPTLTANSFLNGAGFQRGFISPCSIATIIGAGLAPGIQGVVIPTTPVGPLPYLLAGDRVSFANSQAPIFNVANVNSQEQITVQVPCDLTPGSNVPVTINVSGGSATVNVPVLPASPGIFETVGADGHGRAVLLRQDGSFVSLDNPARRNEIVRMYVTGMGPASPVVGTNQFPTPVTDANVTGQVIAGINNAGVRVVSARVAPNLIGVFEIAFQVPSDALTGNTVVLSVAVNVPGDVDANGRQITRFSNGSNIPIQ